jgi:hypothetical protein
MISNSPCPLVSVDSALQSGDESSARYTGKRSRIHTVLSALSIGCAGLLGSALATCQPSVRDNSAFCDAAGVCSSSSNPFERLVRGPIGPPPGQLSGCTQTASCGRCMCPFSDPSCLSRVSRRRVSEMWIRATSPDGVDPLTFTRRNPRVRSSYGPS